MRAAAKLDRALAGVHHSYVLAIFVAEKGDRPFGLRFSTRKLFGPHGHISEDWALTRSSTSSSSALVTGS